MRSWIHSVRNMVLRFILLHHINLHRTVSQRGWTEHLSNSAGQCWLLMISWNSSGSMLFCILLTSATIHSLNISWTQHHIRDGTMPNQMYLICENSELLSGSFCKDRRCYQNQNAKFTLAMMMVLRQSNIIMQKHARYLPLKTQGVRKNNIQRHILKICWTIFWIISHEIW